MYIALLFAMIFFGLRFGALLPALAVSENGPLLPRAWKLSAGNFWRIFAVVLAIFIPVQIAAALVQLAVEGPQAFVADLHPTSAMAAAQLHGFAMNMPMASGINFLFAPLWLGLLLGAGGSLYRTLCDTRRSTRSRKVYVNCTQCLRRFVHQVLECTVLASVMAVSLRRRN